MKNKGMRNIGEWKNKTIKVWRIKEWEILVDEKNKTIKVWRIKEWERLACMKRKNGEWRMNERMNKQYPWMHKQLDNPCK